jgi:Dyp-type peroxidase family
METLPPRGTPIREPFGFVDGVSQPVMRGTGRHKPGMKDQHIIEPGEFILGYPDGLGTYPQSPKVKAIADPHNDLYAASEEWPEQRPDFSKSLAPATRDLGKDGSFMVIRQLEQDVEGFHKYVDKAVKQLNSGPCPLPVDSRWVGAKMVGRWDDGSSLVRNQYEPRTNRKPDARPDNDFLYGKEDPQGLRCPYGAHIRRANPRESQDPKSKEQIDITNRHRILRAGRVYEEDGKKGLMFICLNGDIERQFEFIQQTWSLAKTFHGLESETDPFINDMGDDSRYTIPMIDGARTITGLKNFVTTKGGGYFFVPGKQAMRFLSIVR